MKAARGPRLGIWLAICFHTPLVATGLYRNSFDATTHMFLADHYRRSWFALWEPRWFGGFSISSYPPLAHQVLALLSIPFGHDRAFAILLLATLIALPAAVWRFAGIFVAPAAASAAAVLAAFLPGIALAAYSYGQLPTLVSLSLTLVLVSECTRFVERGGRLRLALTTALAGTAFAAHHATPVLFFPPALLAALTTVIVGVEGEVRMMRIRRAGTAITACAVAGVVVIAAFWIWVSGGIHQAFIPHNSRNNLLTDFAAQSQYLWAVYGIVPALALSGVWRNRDRRSIALAILAGVLAVIGLGGTTPLPALLFGAQWQWLTYDRFALWGAVAMLPLAGAAVSGLFSARLALSRLAGIAALAVLSVYAGANGLASLDLSRSTPDLRPIAQFMNAGRTPWRYQTFGLGEAAAQLGYLTPATTIDGAYHSARRLPELTGSGIGMLDAALWWDPSGRVLRQVLARANAYSMRWAFVAEPRYEPYLMAAGFHSRGTLAGGIDVWENTAAPPLSPAALSFHSPDVAGILWGTLPLAAAFFALVLALAQRRIIAIDARPREQWMPQDVAYPAAAT